MKKVIEDILEAEKEARERLDRARDASKQKRKEAEEKAGQLVAAARTDVLKEAKTVVEKAEAEANKNREARLAQARRDSESKWEEKKAHIDEAVKVLTRLVLDGDEG
jgi:V/A-type H+-transporting ATPase subunit G/H